MSALRPALGGVLSVAAAALSGAADSLTDAARIARFARGALEFRARNDDVFISSYPRSGTTWLQYALHLLLGNGEGDFAHISEVAPWYERSLALGTRRAQDFELMRSPRIFKSHLPYAWLPRGARYVYAIRDGRDVAVSYHHLYRSHLGSQEGFDAFFERFLRGDLQYGSWFDHVASFLAEADRPDVHIVRYEGLMRDLVRELSALSAFLGLDHGKHQIAELSRACSFEAMKRDEHRFDHATQEPAVRGMQTGVFLRRGRVGDHTSYFSEPQLQRFEAQARKAARAPRLNQLHAFLH